MARARKPIASDSPSAITPRITGSRKIRCRAIGDLIGWCTSAMSPSGFRTATAQFDGPRIITPSRTACPPTVVIDRSFQTDRLPADGRHGRLLPAAGATRTLEPALEALDPAAGVHELLLPRVERV